MNSRIHGNIGLGKAISYFTEKGYIVSIPLNDSQAYDLVVDNGKEIFKVEVKTSRQKVSEGVYEVDLRTSGGNQSFHTVKYFDRDACDYLFVYLETGGIYLIPTSQLNITSSISVGNKYKEFRQN